MSEFVKKYLIKANKEDLFHTSGYGKAQSGTNIGSASAESFAARLAIDKNRKIVKGYEHSNIMGRNIVAGSPHPKAYTPPERNIGPIRSPKSPGK